MSSTASVSPVRQLIENHCSQLRGEVESLFSEAQERGRREFAEQLNQAVRRLRQAEDLGEIAATLVDVSGGFCAGAALLRIEGDVARGERSRGLTEENAQQFVELEIPLPPALASAVESRDPVVAVAAPTEISERLAGLLQQDAASRAAIYPVVVRDGVPALLYCWGDVQGAAIELLTQAAAGAWSEIDRPAPAPLVQIVAAAEAPVPEAVPKPAPTWDQLPAGEQQVHLRAQRFARVQVAQMRLREPEAVQAGRARRDLYHQLQKPIDAGRETFRMDFFGPCTSMVDYFHLELVRTLANDDVELLGDDYPGPMV